MNFKERFNEFNFGIKRPDTSELDKAIREIRHRMYPEIIDSNLYYSEEPKVVIKFKFSEKQKFVLYKNGVIKQNENYTFKYQSLITGRVSKNLKRELMDAELISDKYLQTGGGYPDKLDFKNNVKVLQDYYYEILTELFRRRSEKLKEYYRSLFDEKNKAWWNLYNEYLLSSDWNNKRISILERDNYICQVCGISGVEMHVHHLSYENVGDELSSELMTVCRDCHQDLHLDKELS